MNKLLIINYIILTIIIKYKLKKLKNMKKTIFVFFFAIMFSMAIGICCNVIGTWTNSVDSVVVDSAVVDSVAVDSIAADTVAVVSTVVTE